MISSLKSTENKGTDDSISVLTDVLDVRKAEIEVSLGGIHQVS